MKKCFLFLIFICCLNTQILSYSGGVFYGFPLLYANFTNSHLNTHYAGVYGYSFTPGYQHLGWHAGFMISTIPATENVYGSLFGGILLAQELKAGIVSLTFSALPGIGIGVTDLAAYPAYLTLTGEIQAALGFYASEWMQFSLYGGIQGFTNLFPLVPFQDFALYAATMGIKLTWHG